MEDIALFSTAIMIGLMGSTHCLGMCGGISSAQSFSQGIGTDSLEKSRLPAADRPESSHVEPVNSGIFAKVGATVDNIGAPPGRAVLLPRLLTFNAGRLISYTLIGFLAGVAGAALSLNMHLMILLRSIAAIMLILMGLYIGQWYTGLVYIEKAGEKLWSRLSPIADNLRRKQGLAATLGLGFLWGWLPCGLVYSALTWSMSSADPSLAAILMLGFGIGTLPSMMAAGLFAYQLRRLFSKLSVRRIFAVVLIIFGLWSLPVHWSQWLGSDKHPAGHSDMAGYSENSVRHYSQSKS